MYALRMVKTTSCSQNCQTIVNRKELFGNEYESSPPLSLDYYFKIVVYDGCVKFEEAEIHRSAIIQDFRDNEKKIKLKKK